VRGPQEIQLFLLITAEIFEYVEEATAEALVQSDYFFPKGDARGRGGSDGSAEDSQR